MPRMATAEQHRACQLRHVTARHHPNGTPVKKAPHHAHQHRGVDRLSDVRIASGGARGVAVRLAVRAGACDDRHVAHLRDTAQALRGQHAARPRHVQVNQDEIRRVDCGAFKSGVAVHGFGHLVAFIDKVETERDARVPRFVNDENERAVTGRFGGHFRDTSIRARVNGSTGHSV